MIGVINILKVDAPVTARIGTGADARVYPLEREQEADLPAVTVDQTDIDPSDTKSGVSSLDEEIVTVTSYDSVFSSCRSLADDCRAALDRASGTHGGVVIQSNGIQFLNEFVDKEEVNNAKVFFIEQNYKVRVER